MLGVLLDKRRLLGGFRNVVTRVLVSFNIGFGANHQDSLTTHAAWTSALRFA